MYMEMSQWNIILCITNICKEIITWGFRVHTKLLRTSDIKGIYFFSKWFLCLHREFKSHCRAGLPNLQSKAIFSRNMSFNFKGWFSFGLGKSNWCFHRAKISRSIRAISTFHQEAKFTLHLTCRQGFGRTTRRMEVSPSKSQAFKTSNSSSRCEWVGRPRAVKQWGNRVA